jgi:hypothetical protein
MTAHVFPPRPSDQRIKDLIAVHGGTSNRDVQDDVREAMALAMGETAAWAVTYSVDDVWLKFKEFMGITDTSEPFDADTLLAGLLTEDGVSFLAKQDGQAIVQE